MNLSKIKRRAAALTIRRTMIVRQLKEEKVSFENNKQTEEDIQEAIRIVQLVAEQIQEKAHNQISAVVCHALSTVFPDKDYGFKINFVKRRSRTEAELVLLNGPNEIINPLKADSGGVLDVASFALRLSCLVLHRPKLRPFLALDEPFKNISEEGGYRENMSELLLKLSKDFGIQMLNVTHIDEYKIGKVVVL